MRLVLLLICTLTGLGLVWAAVVLVVLFGNNPGTFRERRRRKRQAEDRLRDAVKHGGVA